MTDDNGDVARFVEGALRDVPPVKALKVPPLTEVLYTEEPFTTPGFFLENTYDPTKVLRLPGGSPPVPLLVVEDKPAHEDGAS